MYEKKNIVITFRLTESLKKEIDKIAREKEWSTSKVVEKIITEYFKHRSS